MNNLIEEVLQSIKQIEGFGSVEIYIQDYTVTQITTRKIKKTNSKVASNGHKIEQTIDKPISIY